MQRPVVKRLLSMVLAAAMLVCLISSPAAVWAAELEKPVTITDTASYINPVYAHLEAPVSDCVAVASTGETYEAADVDEAAALLKEVLLSRANAAVIQLPVDFSYDAENRDAFWEEVWAMEEEIFAKAVAHTGNPLEGDYIRYNYYRRSMTAGASFGETTTISIDYTFTYHASAEQEQAVTEVIDAFIEEYGLAGITDPAADMEKFLIAYGWLCGKTTYSDTIETAPSTNYSSYGAVVEGDCVCQGYAVTLYRLLLELGVDCRVISGTDGDGGKHAWNIVELDGVYYNTDATWDDSWQEAGQAWEWCLRCDANFPDHIRNEEFTTESFYAAYPMATEDQPDINGGGSSGETPVLEIGTPAQVTVTADIPYGDYAVTPTVTEGYRATVTGCTDSYCSFIDSEGDWLGELAVLEAGETYTLWFEAYVETDTEITVSVDLAHDFYKGVCRYCDETANIVASGTCGDDLSWTLDSGNGLTITGTGAIYDYTYTDYAPWYDVRGDIRYIFLDEAVTRVGDYAFYQTESLQECLLHEGLVSIGTAAFLQTGLKEVSFPSTLTTLDADAFWNCNGLTEVVIPANLVNLDLSAFDYCHSMTAYTVAEGHPNYSSADGVLFNKDKTELVKFPLGNTAAQYTAPDTVVTIREFAFDGCRLRQVEIPASVTAIGEFAFSDCERMQAFVVAEENANYSAGSNGELMNKDQTLLIRFPGAYSGSYTVPATVTTIENSAFRNSNELTSVVIPENVTEIRDLAFQYCWKLEKVEVYNPNCVFGSAVLNASESAVLYGYTGSTAETHAANEGYTFVSLGEYAGGSEEAPTSGECGDSATWSLENGVLTISGTGSMTNYIEASEVPWYAYAQSITAVEICSGITSVGQYAFSLLPALQTVSLADTVDTIWNYAFQSSGYLRRVNLAEGLTDIYVGAFEGCAALTDIRLPESLESICEYVFADSGLQQVTVPANVTMVSDYAFSGCAALTTVSFEGNAPDYLGDNAFQNVTSTVYYPANDETWTEDIMQQYGGTLTWVAYGEAEEELFELSGANLTLGDGLDMNFYIEPSKVAEGYYAVITRSYADSREDHVVTVPYADWNSMMGEIFYVTYTGIAAKEMGDNVSVVIYNASGEAVSKPWNDSVQAYAVRMLNDNPTEKLQTLLVDMLNYGAEAQTYFGYNTDDLVTDVLTDAQKACATASYETESKLVSGTGRAGTALTLKNRITLDFIFKNSAIGSDYTGLYAIATYTDHYGDTVETRIDTVKVFSDSYGYVSVPGLSTADYGQAVTCTVYDAEDNVLAWATDSIEGYAHRMRGHLPEMVEAIIKFGQSAYNFFH